MIQRDSGEIECHRDITASREAVAIVQGWNAPDTRSPLNLTYYVGMTAPRTAQIEAALRHWGVVVIMSLEKRPYETAQLRFVFESIDGPGKALARAHYPGQPRAGLIEFDSAEDWDALDLRAAALHEIGHALGLGHTYDDREAVMYWIFRGTERLAWADVLAASKLYLVRFVPTAPHLPQ